MLAALHSLRRRRNQSSKRRRSFLDSYNMNTSSNNNILLYFQVNIPATTIIFSLLYESYTSYYIIYY